MGRISFSTLGCPDLSVARVADLAAQFGFDGVELRVTDDDAHELLKSETARAECLKAFRKVDVEILSICSYLSIRDVAGVADGRRKLAEQYISLASDLDAGYVRIFPRGLHHERLSAEDILDAAEINAAADVKRHNVCWAVETHDEYTKLRELNKVTTRLPSMGVVWDTGNTWIAGEDISESFALLNGQCTYIQVKDVRTRLEAIPTPLGDGSFPFDALASVLRLTADDLWISWEYEAAWYPELTRIEHLLENASESMRRLWRALDERPL